MMRCVCLSLLIFASHPTAGWGVEPLAPLPTAEEVVRLPALEPSAESLPAEDDVLDLESAAEPRRGGQDQDERRPPLQGKLFWIPQQDVANAPGTLAMNGEQFDFAFPLRIGPEGVWLAQSSVQRLELTSDAVLPDSGQPLPDELWHPQFGVMHFRTLANGWKAGGILSIGSPSDAPFEALRDVTVGFIGFLKIPHGERNAWNLSLFYSPTGQLTFPVPGVSYTWRPNDRLRLDLGVPFALEYRPTDAWTLTAKYTPLVNAEALATRTLNEAWSLYGGYRTTNDAYFLADRTNDQERFYLFDQRLLLGVRRQLPWRLTLDFAAAYVFDRELFQAEQFSSGRQDQLDIEPGVAGMLQLAWTR